MKWYEHLYVGDSVADKVDKIKWKIMHNAGMFTVYVIALASNPDNLLDIIPASNLVQKGYPKENLRIVGLAGGYDEALELVRRIVEETYEHTNDIDVYEYLKESRRNTT